MLRSRGLRIQFDSERRQLLCASGAVEISRWWSAARNHRTAQANPPALKGRQTHGGLSPFQGWEAITTQFRWLRQRLHHRLISTAPLARKICQMEIQFFHCVTWGVTTREAQLRQILHLHKFLAATIHISARQVLLLRPNRCTRGDATSHHSAG